MWKWVVAAVIPIGLALASLAHVAYKPLELSGELIITVAPGENTTRIAAKLDQLGMLRSQRVFRWWAKLRRIDRHLQPGRYVFSEPISMDGILDVLKQGRRHTVNVTLPEGWSVEQIAQECGRVLEFPAEDFIELTRDSSTLVRWEVPNGHMEGYLLPETYTFFWDATPADVIERLASASAHLFADSVRARMGKLKMTRHEVLTLASMIEAETGSVDERPRIAAVFHNRLTRRMRLQCDPTVVYAMGGLAPGRQLWSNDLKIDSPYNTYLHYGLPPGPICNPGRAAIMAALYPDETNELYFVANGNGGHVFSKTLKEHNRARARVKKAKPR